MQRFILTLGAVALALPLATPAVARHHYVHYAHARHCRYSSGTTGLVAGGVGGAIVGQQLIGGGIAGPLVGAVGGALAGRAIDRSMTAHKRCN